MDRYWLLTCTCYGTWLPGDERGFVGRVWEHRTDDPPEERRVEHDTPGTPCDGAVPGLERAAQTRLKGEPVHLTLAQAQVLLEQLFETARFRRWEIAAVAIIHNHFHIIVGVPGDPNPAKVLGDFKSWGTRKLTEVFGEPASKTWWTERGSTRKLPDKRALGAAFRYVVDQPNALVVWQNPASVEA